MVITGGIVESNIKKRLQELFLEAKEDSYAGVLDGYFHEARVVYGVKISRDRFSEEVTIYDVMNGGDFYKKIRDEDVIYLFRNGWREGVYDVYLSNIRSKIDYLVRSIEDGNHRSIAVKKMKSQLKKELEKEQKIKQNGNS